MSWVEGDHSRRDLEETLRAHRPSPRPGFVAEVAHALRAGKPRRTFLRSRLAFVTALVVILVGVFASFGGVTYAAEGISHSVAGVKAAVHGGPRVVHNSPATDQYQPPPSVTPPAGGGVSGGGGGGGTQPAAMGNLPFTGFPLVFTTAIAFGLILLGLLLHRREQRL
jgi:hypothetical protein